MKEKLLEAMKNGLTYEFIATNYHQMKSEDLKQVILELLFAICKKYDVKAYEELCNEASKTLAEYWQEWGSLED